MSFRIFLASLLALAFAVPSATGSVLKAQVQADAALPFHSEVAWQLEQVPVPAGRCTKTLPAGLAYLWLSKITATAQTTHLGRGGEYLELCVFGSLTDPDAAPPNNGVPVSYYADVQYWTAANGDVLKGTGGLIGFTAPPGTPGFKLIEEVTFVDGGTGRFGHASGYATAIVDPVAETAVYDGWISYGK